MVAVTEDTTMTENCDDDDDAAAAAADDDHNHAVDDSPHDGDESDLLDHCDKGDDDANDVFDLPPPPAPTSVNLRQLLSQEEKARRITLQRFEGSEYGRAILFHSRNTLPKFDEAGLVRGRRLGKGSFSNVDEIRGIVVHDMKRGTNTAPSSAGVHHAGNLIPITSPTAAADEIPKFPRPSRATRRREDTVAAHDVESRQFIARHCYRNSGCTRYAIKMVRKDRQSVSATNANKEAENWPRDHHPNGDHRDDVADAATTGKDHPSIMGISDLAIETAFLSTLRHPNIIKLRAVASADPFSERYFLIVDRLLDTLQKRIEVTWYVRERRLYSMFGRLVRDRCGKRRLEFFEHRLERAFDLASAIEYLHQKKLFHRDVKRGMIRL